MFNDFSPSITFPNMRGDVTISWTKENEDFIKQMIEKKMKEGYSFFVIIPRKIFGMDRPRVKTKLTLKNKDKNLSLVNEVILKEEKSNKAKDIIDISLPVKKENKYKIENEGISLEFNVDDDIILSGLKENKLVLARTDKSERSVTKIIRRAISADEIIEEQSVAIRPIVGG
jgi:hypothetical protein